MLAGGNVNERSMDMGGATPLHMACKHGNKDVVKALLDAGADPNARANLMMTPTHLMVFSMHMAGCCKLNPGSKHSV